MHGINSEVKFVPECLNASVLKDSAGWLPFTHAQPISKLGLVTVVTDFHYGCTS
jgi:hypothetical protein